MATADGERRRTLWLAVACALLVLAIAQGDEHRRYERARAAYVDALSNRAAASAAYLDRVSEFLGKPKEQRGAMPPPPPNVAQPAPPEPVRDRYLFVARIRQTLCFGAFAAAAAMLAVWGLSSPEVARRHGRFVAEMILALA